MRARRELLAILLAAVGVAGCLGDGDVRGEYRGGSIDALRVENTTDVPVNDVSRDALEQNEVVHRAIAEAYENRTGGEELSEREAEAASRFLEQFDYYRPDRYREDKPAGFYFTYRDGVVAVSVTQLD